MLPELWLVYPGVRTGRRVELFSWKALGVSTRRDEGASAENDRWSFRRAQIALSFRIR